MGGRCANEGEKRSKPWPKAVGALLCVSLIAMAGGFWWLGSGYESLVRQLYNPNPDFVWIPNDVYGHVGDELWNLLVLKMAATNGATWDVQTQIGRARNWRLTETNLRLDRKAVPDLVALMASSNLTAGESIRRMLAHHFKGRVHEWLYPFDETVEGDPVIRRHIAAFEGFSVLGTNAEAALPALSNLLASGRSDLPLMWSIAKTGPKGAVPLIHALSSSDEETRHMAADVLGLEGRWGAAAIPALVECVRRGDMSGEVLGALGRLGCDEPALVPLLIDELKKVHPMQDRDFDDGMAFLVLGLMGERAGAAAPLAVSGYLNCEMSSSGDAGRRFFRRILGAIAPDQLKVLPPPRSLDELNEEMP